LTGNALSADWARWDAERIVGEQEGGEPQMITIDAFVIDHAEKTPVEN